MRKKLLHFLKKLIYFIFIGEIIFINISCGDKKEIEYGIPGSSNKQQR